MFYLGSRRSLEFDLALAYFRRDLHRAVFQDKKTKPKEVCIHHATVTGVLKYISPHVNCGLIDISCSFGCDGTRFYFVDSRYDAGMFAPRFFVNLFHHVIL